MAREMKDTGTWAHKIPLKWKTMNFSLATQKITTGLNPRNNFKLNECSAKNYYVTIRNFKNGKLFLDDNCDKITDDALYLIQKRSNLKKNDILFASISKEGQAYLILNNPQNWNINESVFSIRVNETFFCAKYFYYQITNPAYYESLKTDATGSTFKSIKQEKLKQSTVVRPPLSEQQKIANFLDEKVKEIDNAIEKTKETIELYKKYKQAIITEAVTKGLDSNTELNVINVKGINKIPKTWLVADFTKVNYIRGRLGWKGLKADEYVDQGYPFLSAFNIINDKLSWNNLNFITKERYDESPEIKLKENDLLLVKDGNGIGKCAFIDSLPLGEATVNSSLAVITPIDLVHYKYEYYFFLSTIFQNVIWQLKNGMGVPHLTQESMKNIKMPLPPIKEQIEIALYLDNKCNYIDKVISKEESIIFMLENYKKSFIYEYVTGKRRC
ncbi:restriction endonuclease subunit S [Sharpea azabuensis]|uniref:restriction endonuclease subunit S n=1 Tax=Sharpea azabuensis TaxID=322505 RepID=UPI00156C24D1|nr:restriction endonuclease subunit S [Sharpea azabuensis]MDD6511611.1 restriction endonuclease subunit S [Sharpea azabuensis]